MKLSRKLLMLLAVLLSFSLIAAACGDDDESDADTGSDDVTDDDTTDDDMADDDMADSLGDGSLGTITVEPGAEVQIRSLNAITGDVAFLGIPNQAGIELAVSHYGDIHGFAVTSGAGLDDLCSAEGGQAAAQQIVADEQVAGVIGTSCSGAAAAAAPLISDAGLAMISGSNTSPSLTSDLQGNAAESYVSGYYRTAHNDLFQGAAMADFVFNDLGLTTAAAIHDGDPYTQGLAQAFMDAFTELGGENAGFTSVAKGDTDMVPVLTEVAGASPQALFFPIFPPEGNFIAAQAGGVSGLEDTQLLAADGLLVDNFMEDPASEGMYMSGPDVRFGTNVNESTGQTAADVLAEYETLQGEPPSAAFWGHSYDAAAMLLDAITAASHVDADGNLVIDRAGIREFLNGISGYSGLIGTINCDEFGDCGSQKITISHHTDASDIEAGKANVVFEYAPA